MNKTSICSFIEDHLFKANVDQPLVIQDVPNLNNAIVWDEPLDKDMEYSLHHDDDIVITYNEPLCTHFIDISSIHEALMSYVCPFFKSALLVEDHTLDASYFVEKDDSYYSFSLIQTYLTMVLLILTLYVASQFFKIGKPSILHQYSLSRLCASNTFI